jgi:hypothetical protein
LDGSDAQFRFARNQRRKSLGDLDQAYGEAG